MEIIKRKDVMQMLRLKPGTITVCTYDENRKTGGKRKIYIDVMLAGYTEDNLPEAKPSSSAEVNSKMPAHKVNATANIRCKNGDIDKIHPCLIEFYNGKMVSL